MLKWALQLLLITATAIIGTAFLRWWHIRRTRQPAPQALSLIRPISEAVTLLRPKPDTLTVNWHYQSQQTHIVLHSIGKSSDSVQQIVHNVQTVTFTGLHPTQRYLVEITFDDKHCVEVAERIVPLKSVPNFRDIGGYSTREGQQVRWHRVYRASRLSNLSPDDLEALGAMGIQLVCDLRTEDEVQHEPDKLPEGVRLIHLPAQSSANRWVELGRMMFTADYLPNLLLNAYCKVMLDQNPQVFRQVFQELANADNYPVILHCAAGKDRTGIAVALIYSLLDVPDEVIIADYTQSNAYYEFFRDTTQQVMLQLQRFGVTKNDFDYLLIADGELMQKTLQYIRDKYGSVEHYLMSAAGVDSTTLEQVKKNLLE
jgi:protein-tyrosine phosphatase